MSSASVLILYLREPTSKGTEVHLKLHSVSVQTHQELTNPKEALVSELGPQTLKVHTMALSSALRSHTELLHCHQMN